MTWSATQYSKFETERTRPVLDLLGRVPTVRAASAVDIGCGPGNSTEQLKRRFPEAVIAGIDSSADMVEAARKRMPDTQFDLEDIITWSTKPAFFDVILANAVFQWVPDHSLLLPAVFAKLTAGGSLAVQMPVARDEAAQRLIREIAADGPWRLRLVDALATRITPHSAGWYFDLLLRCGASVDIWQTTYLHQLGGPGAIVEWFKGSGLHPVLALLDEGERAEFLARYEAAVAQAYPTLPDGTLLLPFPRLFIVANRGRPSAS